MAPPIAIPTVAPTVAATPTFLRRVGTRVVDFFVPEFLRREYRRIIASLCKFKYAYIALAASILFAVAEYEQPGYLPRHQELTLALVRKPTDRMPGRQALMMGSLGSWVRAHSSSLLSPL
jgi:hypothetical protein